MKTNIFKKSISKGIREKKMLDAAVSRDFPTVITYKMPTAWMDRWGHVPESTRRMDRWSHLSESNYRPNGKQNMVYEEVNMYKSGIKHKVKRLC